METDWMFIERMLEEALTTRNWSTWLGLVKAVQTLAAIAKSDQAALVDLATRFKAVEWRCSECHPVWIGPKTSPIIAKENNERTSEE